MGSDEQPASADGGPRAPAPVAAPAGEGCEVAVFAPAPTTYHYRVPARLASTLQVGARVLVRFAGRTINGVVVRWPAPVPDTLRGKDGAAPVLAELGEILPDPPVPVDVVELCLWIAEYYEAPPGEALRAALPAGSHTDAAEVLELTPAGEAALTGGGGGGALPGKQREALVALSALGRVAASRLPRPARAQLPALLAAGLVVTAQTRAVRTRAPVERHLQLRAELDLPAALAALTRAPARRALLERLAAAPGQRLRLREAGGLAAARPLIEAGSAEVVDVAAAGVLSTDVPSLPAAVLPPPLTPEQVVAHDTIRARMGSFATVLLHGVTGSGKTEVYLHAIADVLAAGKGAIVLVPEISLTPQLAARFAARFDDQVAVLHSGLSERERLGEWQRLRRGVARIALGARSAIFAPVADLGMIVVDEEHDGSFKQDEGVRYHARDVALVRAQRAGAVCVLGSATPSMESYALAQAGKIALVRMTHRPAARPMPTVEILDLRTFRPDPEAMLSAPLAQAIEETLAAGDQAILFLNRRGFATFIVCVGCGHSFRCRNCAVSLTYHQHQDRMLCHYCGHAERVPDVCPSCAGKGTIDRKGLGTERVAAAVAARFPSARVARLDRDVASGAKVEAVLSRVARREVDLLVGTQMVTKGHDFPGVTLVGVLCADVGLSLPDFRASERTFQLLAQVAGRAGRGERTGRVLIQTYRPTEPAIVCAAAHDYEGFYAAETVSRGELGYPPHGRLIAIRVDGPDPAQVADVANRLAHLAVRAGDGLDVRGPVAAPLSRLRGRTRWQLWLRSPDRTLLRRVVRSLRVIEAPSSVRIGVDVDPVSAL